MLILVTCTVLLVVSMVFQKLIPLLPPLELNRVKLAALYKLCCSTYGRTRTRNDGSLLEPALCGASA